MKSDSLKFSLKQSPSSILPWIIAMALFLETLDITILSTSIPSISKSLNTNPMSLKISISAYLFSLGIFIPLSGWSASRFGFSKIFISALALFGIGSIFCGISTNLITLVMGRVIQGIGGAIMMPIGRLILIECYPSDDLLKVTNSITIPSLLGPILGPFIGGVLSEYFSWRWIFFINIPIILTCIFLSINFIPSYKSATKSFFNWKQFFFLCTGIIGIITGNELHAAHLISIQTMFFLFITSFIFLFIFIYFWKKNPTSFFNLNVFKEVNFSFTVLGSFMSRCAVGGIPFMIPLMLQLAFHFSPIKAGYIFSLFALSMMFMKFFVPQIVRKFGYEKSLFLSTLLLGISVSLFYFCNSKHIILFILNLIMTGFFNSLQFSCLNVFSFLKISSELRSSATSIEATIKQISMGLGVTISTSLLVYFSPLNELPSIIHFQKVFLIGGVYIILCSLIFLILNKINQNKNL